MADTQSETCPYQSRYGGGWQAPSQFLAESMVARQARMKKTSLPLKFWRLERWNREYQAQARHASSLLRLYDCEAIMRALRTPEGKKIYSLGAKFLDPLVRVEQERLDRLKAARQAAPPEPEPEPPAKDASPRPAFVETKSTLSKLRDL